MIGIHQKKNSDYFDLNLLCTWFASVVAVEKRTLWKSSSKDRWKIENGHPPRTSAESFSIDLSVPVDWTDVRHRSESDVCELRMTVWVWSKRFVFTDRGCLFAVMFSDVFVRELGSQRKYMPGVFRDQIFEKTFASIFSMKERLFARIYFHDRSI